MVLYGIVMYNLTPGLIRVKYPLSRQAPAATSIIDVKKTTAWGESGFPARLLGGR